MLLDKRPVHHFGEVVLIKQKTALPQAERYKTSFVGANRVRLLGICRLKFVQQVVQCSRMGRINRLLTEHSRAQHLVK